MAIRPNAAITHTKIRKRMYASFKICPFLSYAILRVLGYLKGTYSDGLA